MSAGIINLIDAHYYFHNLGIDTFPLSPGKKSPPLIAGWQKDNLAGVWDGISPNANIAIRCGGISHLAVIDCDEKNFYGTFENIMGYLEGMRIDVSSLPIVQTASGIGRHIYLRLYESVPGNYVLINKEFGSGEIRYGPGAYVVAPPSVIENTFVYKVIQGAFAYIPYVMWKDLSSLVKNPFSNTLPKKKWISKKAWKLLHGDFEIPRDYPSRSEAECALMVSLINTGHSKEEILNLFEKYPCGGKFKELGG